MDKAEVFLEERGLKWQTLKETKLMDVLEKKSLLLLEEAIQSNHETSDKSGRPRVGRQKELEDYLLEEIFTIKGALQIVDQKKLAEKTGMGKELIEVPTNILKEIEMVFLYPPEGFILLGAGYLPNIKDQQKPAVRKFRNELIPGYELKLKFLPEQTKKDLDSKYYELIQKLGRSGISEMLKREFLPFLIEMAKKEERKRKKRMRLAWV